MLVVVVVVVDSEKHLPGITDQEARGPALVPKLSFPNVSRLFPGVCQPGVGHPGGIQEKEVVVVAEEEVEMRVRAKTGEQMAYL